MRKDGRFKTRGRLRRLLVGVLFLCLLTGALVACGQREESQGTEAPTAMDYDAVEDWSLYVSIEGYTGLEIRQQGETPKGEILWKELLSRVKILAYPEEQVRYYEAQKKATYSYYGEQRGWSLEETMEKLGVTEAQITAEARELVKEDLLYRYIVSDAGITLTEEEKATHFDRYAEQYAQTYGYELSYVKEHMAEPLYDTMLYDKTMEYLILNNTFVSDATTE